MTVSVVTPWLEHRELREQYMLTLKAGPEPDERIVVDNASDPPLPFAKVRLERNAGFCGGSNAGLDAASSDVVVFLNNDVYALECGWLERLVSRVEPGVLVGRLLDPEHAVVDGMRLPYLEGWCLAGMREDFAALGGFDETLEEPAYFSDNDLCLRARCAGMRLRGVSLGLAHVGGITAGPQGAGSVRRAYRANYERYAQRVRELTAVAA